MKRLAILTITIVFSSLSSLAQAPCPAGTLSNVLGTSCTVGKLTLNFQNNFQGSVVTVGSSEIVSPLSPNAIGFIPIQVGNQAGFLLRANFFDDANGTGLTFSQHNITFSYAPQVNGAFEILEEAPNWWAI